MLCTTQYCSWHINTIVSQQGGDPDIFGTQDACKYFGSEKVKMQSASDGQNRLKRWQLCS